MQDHKRLYRIFQLIARLKTPLGVKKDAVAADFEVSVRTIERYIDLLVSIGFEIDVDQGRYRLRDHRKQLNTDDMVVFSFEEAALIRDAMINNQVSSPLHKGILEKLYALTDMDEISDQLYFHRVSRHLNVIRRCIKEKKVCELVNYESVNSDTISTRCVEPIRFLDYYRYLLAYEMSAGEVRQFKVDRIGDVKELNRIWKHEDSHQYEGIDVFGMVGQRKEAVRLQLSTRAFRLLIEEFPDARSSIFKEGGKYEFRGKVNGLKAVGRFVMGLADEIDVIEPQGLIDYVSEKSKKFRARHYLS